MWLFASFEENVIIYERLDIKYWRFISDLWQMCNAVQMCLPCNITKEKFSTANKLHPFVAKVLII